MNCDDFLSALETGTLLRRFQARRHAARCPACARALAGWQALKLDLAMAPLLTARQRDLWTSVVGLGQTRPRANYPWGAAAVAIAASLLLLLFLWSVRHRNAPAPEIATAPRPGAPVAVVPISRESIAMEMSPLEKGLDQMEAELATLSQRAALADVKRQTETLLEAYRNW